MGILSQLFALRSSVAQGTEEAEGQEVGPAVTALVGGVISLSILHLWRKMGVKASKDSPKGTEVTATEARDFSDFDEFPPDVEKVFSLETLARFDGEQKPMCMGVCGKVVNVSSSENIKVGQGYGKLWAGKDATFALAKLSLSMTDANRMDFTLDQFTVEEFKALAGWYKHFTTKYPIVGRLSEYEGWDFSSVVAAAKDLPVPFASSSSASAEAAGAETAKEGDVAAANSTASPVAAKAAPDFAKAATFQRGDRVAVQGLAKRPELNGKEGFLNDFNAVNGRFVVKLDDGQQIQLLPTNMCKVTDMVM